MWADWPIYEPECRRAVQRVLVKGGKLTAYQANPQHGPEPTLGSWAWKLEREAERVHKIPYVVACANGTMALATLLKVLYPHGGEIVTTAFTFSATISAILGAGLQPVFADVVIPTGNLLAESGTRMATERTVDFLTVDLFGCQAGFVGTVTDACQAVGIPPLVSHGVWSFNGRKNVPAGEGGAIFTQDHNIAKRCRLMLGHAENFHTDWVGGNGHMNEVTACVAYHGMRKVKQRNAHRTRMAKILNDSLRGIERVLLPDLTHHALYMYSLVIDNGMEKVADRLQNVGVECQRGYIRPPLYRYRAFQGFRRDSLPNTEALSQDRLLLFPQVTPTASRQEMERLGEQIRQALK